MKRLALLTVSLVVALAAGSPLHAGEAEIVAHRQADMKTLKTQIQALSRIVKGGQPITTQTIEQARTLAGTAKGVAAAFEPDTRGGSASTKAVDGIWEEWDQFKALTVQFENRAQALLAAAESGDRQAFTGALKNVAAGCKACHSDYKSWW